MSHYGELPKNVIKAATIINDLKTPIFNTDAALTQDAERFKASIDKLDDEGLIFAVTQRYYEVLKEAKVNSGNYSRGYSSEVRSRNASYLRIMQKTIPPEYIAEKTNHPSTLALLAELIADGFGQESYGREERAMKLVLRIREKPTLRQLAERAKDQNSALSKFAAGSIICRKADHSFTADASGPVFSCRCEHCGISMENALREDFQYQ